MNIIRASDYFQNRAVNYEKTLASICSILDVQEDYGDVYFSNFRTLWDFYEETFLLIPQYSIGASTFKKCLKELADEMPSGESRDGKTPSEFLVIIQMVFTIAKTIQSSLRGNHIVKNRQLMAIAENAVTKLAYKFIAEGKVYVVSAIDPVAEAVAAAADKEENAAIYDYLTSLTDADKVAALNRLTLLAASVANKAKEGSNQTISGLSEYLQLIRHPENKNNPKYASFYENGSLKREFYKDIFDACVFYLSSIRAKEVYRKLLSAKQQD